MIDDPPEEDVFSILVATDTHLGYEVDHPVRGNDSFVTFEEILHIGRENDVDLILLGGDLFHLTKPSAETLHRCMSLLRQYCMGDRPVSFEIVSDQEKNFENTTQKVVNYEDPNYNVSIPVFSIHGNHDDPTGQSNTSALDILSCAGLVNYFGKCVDVTDVPINPLLLRKGKSLLSIYGLGHIVDKRLCRLFEAGKVNFYQPEEQHDDWFNILVIHQNRAARGVKGYIDESALPGMLDLIIWGHEHDCRVEPEFNATKNFHVMQPGSSVATSLAEGESLPKHVAIVKIYKKQFECTPIPLETVRPFVFRDANVSEVLMENPKDLKSLTEKIEEGATKLVQEMIKEALAKKTGHPKQPALPLIRLRLFFEDEGDMINIVRFNQKFEGSVANPTDLLLMKKGIADKKVKRDVLAREVLADILNGEQENWDVKIEDYVQKYFNEQEDNGNDLFRLNVLSVTGLNAGLSRMVDLQDNNAIDFIVKYVFHCPRIS
ncbi:hypothetical protein ONE63_002048 [Megalurothrips usitatus]|uniref:Mre11 DNA-binding domain-containing protein n=1 Tax=Megalurothrips usitatus TaxID=439358 RepID=A0AAV7XHJ3_9NEOP|nr:hypothetical protein ONE63_002048 [Megalurothrips usitatus]